MKKSMYRINKTMTFESSHKLEGLAPRHPCSNIHGHSYKAVVTLKGESLDDVGMVMDFNLLRAVKEKLDHKHLNDVIPRNPTAENIARFIYEAICGMILQMEALGQVEVEKVRVHETETSWAEFWTEEVSE